MDAAPVLAATPSPAATRLWATVIELKPAVRARPMDERGRSAASGAGRMLVVRGVGERADRFHAFTREHRGPLPVQHPRDLWNIGLLNQEVRLGASASAGCGCRRQRRDPSGQTFVADFLDVRKRAGEAGDERQPAQRVFGVPDGQEFVGGHRSPISTAGDPASRSAVDVQRGGPLTLVARPASLWPCPSFLAASRSRSRGS